MKKYEYKIITGDLPLFKDRLKEEILNDYGKNGWELVKEKTYWFPLFIFNSYWIFKREIN